MIIKSYDRTPSNVMVWYVAVGGWWYVISYPGAQEQVEGRRWGLGCGVYILYPG